MGASDNALAAQLSLAHIPLCPPCHHPCPASSLADLVASLASFKRRAIATHRLSLLYSALRPSS